ncbi:hypothetical protein LOD99_7385 [Oopsacas minuta]|uniref:Uncharacterized protein n=1 Tax=Oopsacas minuta TaxID=111878 RepID=A0AAV7JTV6_9METZ|nr:hypothetical protein LOD99_7385 [Oopsacas minuta]
MKGINTRLTTVTLIVLTEQDVFSCVLTLYHCDDIFYMRSLQSKSRRESQKFSVSLDVINPRDRNHKFMSIQSKSEVDLSGVVDSATVSNLDDGLWLIMTIKSVQPNNHSKLG